MLKMTIDNEEVLSNNDISIKEEILSPSSTILNNVYPKSWELDKDYTSRFYYPKDYSKLNIQNFSIEPEEAGTTIQINGSATLNDVDTSKESRVLRILGQTSQNGTPTPSSPIPINVVSGDNEIVVTGKNLFNTINLNYVVSSGRYTKYENGVVSSLPTAMDWSSETPPMSANPNISQRTVVDNYGLLVLPNIQYTFSFDNPNNCNVQMLVFQYDKNFHFIKNTSSPTNSNIKQAYTLTTDTNTRYLMIRFDNESYNSEAKQLNVQNIMLLKGSYNTSNLPSYEDYKGEEYEINLGKNLFNLQNWIDNPITYHGAIGEIEDDTIYIDNTVGVDAFTSTGLITSGNLPADQRIYAIEIKPNTTYILSFIASFASSSPRLNSCYYSLIDKDYNCISFSNMGNMTPNVKHKVTITTTSDTKYLTFRLGADITLSKITYSEIQLEESLVGTSYAPYFLPIELCKIGTYQDYIYKDNGSWYLHKEIGKVVLDGSENWTLNQPSTYVNQYLMSGTNLSEDVASGTSFIMSDYFKYKQGNPSSTTNEDYMWVYSKKLVLDVRKTIATDANSLKTWITTNKPIFYFQLETPTNTEITDTTLLEQLESLSS